MWEEGEMREQGEGWMVYLSRDGVGYVLAGGGYISVGAG